MLESAKRCCCDETACAKYTPWVSLGWKAGRRRSRAMAHLVEDKRLDAMAGHQSVVVRLKSEFEHGCVGMVRCRDQSQDVLGSRLGRESRRRARPQARQAQSGSNFRKDIGGRAELLLLQGHARMVLAQCRPLLVMRARGRPARIRHRWHPRVREGQHASPGHVVRRVVWFRDKLRPAKCCQSEFQMRKFAIPVAECHYIHVPPSP
eukprot:scaffold47733_cov69-Phaeocystis_antarctica.AAC.1